MGDQELITNFQNWPMDEAIGGGMGMIAPFWDRIRFTNHGGVYYYYDEDDSRFIVEWYRLHHREGGERDLTFQVILYDHEVWITESGDQNILFQYNSICQARGIQPEAPWERNVPYASVGISSVDGTTGINYSFNNLYPVTAAPLAAGRAIFFSTSPRYKACILYGTVIDHETQDPVERAVVVTKHGFTALTDEEGFWRINGALAEVPFDITARAQGYNDSTQFDFEVDEGDSLEINFEILHPEFTPTTFQLNAMLDPGLETELEFILENTGNGPLYWNMDRRLIGEANAEPWCFRNAHNVGADREDSRIQGVVFGNNRFFVSGAHSGNPLIYVYNRDGEFINSLPQPVENDRRGIRDLAWDGELIWGAINDSVYGISTEGEVVHRWEGPYNINSGITWDSDREVIWVCYTTNPPVAYTREGERIDTLSIDHKRLRIYGLAYYPDDPDDHPLYVFHKDQESNRQLVHKFDPITSDTIRVTFLDPEAGGSPEGAFITNQFDVYSWVMMVISNTHPGDGGDRVDIWQVEARKDWFAADIIVNEEREEAAAGTLQTGENLDFIVSLNSTDLPETTFVSELYFVHNADSGRGHINIELQVIGEMEPFGFGLTTPEQGVTIPPYVVDFSWEPSIDPNFDDTVSYIAWIAINEDTLDLAVDETCLSLDFDSLGIVDNRFDYNEVMWWVKAISEEDIVDCDTSFGFQFDYIRAPPEPFDLELPQNGSVLDSSRVTFHWHPSIDPNPMDTLSYVLWIKANQDTVSIEVDIDSITIDLETTNLPYEWMFQDSTEWWVDAISNVDIVECSQRFKFIYSELVGIGIDDNIPVEFTIASIYPSPFNSSATIRFGADVAEHTLLLVYDLAGREVTMLYDGTPTVGWHAVVWNGTRLPSGIYLVRLESAGRVKIAKTALLK